MCVRDREYYKKHQKTYQWEKNQQAKWDETAENFGAFRRFMYKQEFENFKDSEEDIRKNWSVPTDEQLPAEGEDKTPTEEEANADMKEKVSKLFCAGDAFIVFNEEEDRDDA